MDYASAEETFLRELPAQSPARPYFSGIACMNRFLDWGDTTALRRAEAHWEVLSPRGEPPPNSRDIDPERLRLYRGLAGFQLSYAASLRGQNFRAAAFAFSARRQLQGLQSPEARATLMLYAYSRGRILEHLPFVQAPDFDVAAFVRAAEASASLREMFRASLFWIHIDHRHYVAARDLAEDFQNRHPDNRLARQMRADGLYHGGDLAAARLEYEKLREEYAAFPKAVGRLPLGYFRATGNLARIHAALEERHDMQSRLADWKRAERLGLMPWLPRGLARDLAGL
jgi:hypothetical protein